LAKTLIPKAAHRRQFIHNIEVREFALAAPGDDAVLAEQVARLAAEPMNRSRPLWEAYMIHGLSGDRLPC
jgi:hypothetical protein